MYTIKVTNRFKKDIRLCVKRGLNISLLYEAMHLLARDGELPPKYRPHKLVAQLRGKWECHIQPDWLMVWEQNDSELTMLFTNTGSHADIF